jgi:hypothetical protein
MGVPACELNAKRQSRNLNQIAHAANQGQLVTSPGRNDLEAMLRVCGALRDNLKRMLVANLKSWEQGFA